MTFGSRLRALAKRLTLSNAQATLLAQIKFPCC